MQKNSGVVKDRTMAVEELNQFFESIKEVFEINGDIILRPQVEENSDVGYSKLHVICVDGGSSGSCDDLIVQVAQYGTVKIKTVKWFPCDKPNTGMFLFQVDTSGSINFGSLPLGAIQIILFGEKIISKEPELQSHFLWRDVLLKQGKSEGGGIWRRR